MWGRFLNQEVPLGFLIQHPEEFFWNMNTFREHTLSVYSIFVHFCFQSSFIFKFQHYILFFVKVQHSYLYFHHLTIFISFEIAKWPWLFHEFLWKTAIASYGARVRGSVFKMKFRVLSREFESIETSPGFARLLGENWN